jgi:hypothetical protein
MLMALRFIETNSDVKPRTVYLAKNNGVSYECLLKMGRYCFKLARY